MSVAARIPLATPLRSLRHDLDIYTHRIPRLRVRPIVIPLRIPEQQVTISILRFPSLLLLLFNFLLHIGEIMVMVVMAMILIEIMMVGGVGVIVLAVPSISPVPDPCNGR